MPRTCAINDINGDKITGSFYERELQKKKTKKQTKAERSKRNRNYSESVRAK